MKGAGGGSLWETICLALHPFKARTNNAAGTERRASERGHRPAACDSGTRLLTGAARKAQLATQID